MIGALVGDLAKEYISDIDHWIAFGLLAIIGIKMFMEGIRYNMKECLYDFTKLSILITLCCNKYRCIYCGNWLWFTIFYTTAAYYCGTNYPFNLHFFSLLGAFMGMKKPISFKPKIALKLGGIILFFYWIKDIS